MTELRKRMIESLQLRGMSERIQEAYVKAVRQLAQHFQKSPDLVSEEELRRYFLHMKNVKKYSPPHYHDRALRNQVFFEKTLGKHWSTFELIRPAREKKLPTSLARKRFERCSRWFGCRATRCAFRRSTRAG